MRFLTIEDDERLASTLIDGLRAEGFAVDHAGTCEDGFWLATEVPYDAIIIDLGLPDCDGLDLIGRLRAAGRWSPILVLTANQDLDVRVHGLDLGADDYLLKPFAFSELLARLRAIMRRDQHERPAVLTVGGLRLDPAAHRATVGDAELQLTQLAFAILEVLAARAGEAVPRDVLQEHLWDWAFERRSNVIEVYVSTLRSRLRTHPGAPVIETVRGVGYRLVAPTEPLAETT